MLELQGDLKYVPEDLHSQLSCFTAWGLCHAIESPLAHHPSS
jgi:hypothetical protein